MSVPDGAGGRGGGDQEFLAGPGQPLDAVLIKRAALARERHPDLRLAEHVVLKDGPRAYKVATHWVIVDRHTGEIHHHSVGIETYRRRKQGWQLEPEHSITLTNEGGDELRPLATFLGAVLSVDLPLEASKYVVVPLTDDRVGKAAVIADALAIAKGDPDVLRELARNVAADPVGSRAAAAALNLARCSAELATLERLIAEDASERAFQAHLTAHPWIFGSEYSERLDQRRWTRDEQLDFVLRRTADGYVEIIEIKTPLRGRELFVDDPSHHTLYPRSELSAAIGQVAHYLEQIDANRHMIQSVDGEDVHKIRARIVIGRDGDERQAAALRRLNGHLHRIEIFTFDQLVRIGCHVLQSLERVVAHPG